VQTVLDKFELVRFEFVHELARILHYSIYQLYAIKSVVYICIYLIQKAEINQCYVLLIGITVSE